MRALTVVPGRPHTTRVEDVPTPSPSEHEMLVEAIAVGICGTDREIEQGLHGSAPPGEQRLILGHESLGRVVHAPRGCGFTKGDLVVGIVRRPDPEPCASCAVGEWDMCRNGLYTESGIKARHGFASETFALEAQFAIRIAPSLAACGVLLEPASVVAKAWEHVERIGRRSAAWMPRTALITGAGPVGLLAALFGVQRGLEVHVFDRVVEGPKPEIARALGARYHAGALADVSIKPDIVVECTGASAVVVDAVNRTAPAGVVCLTGISSAGGSIEIDLGLVNRTMVLENDAVFGSVNANRRHYEAAAKALASADPEWLGSLITRRLSMSRWGEAFRRAPDDVKTVIEIAA